VTVSNEGGVDLEGEVVLVPQPEPAPRPGAPTATATTTTTPPSARSVLAIGGRSVTAPPPRGVTAPTVPPWPTYRAPVSIPLGTQKTLTVMVLQAPFGFRVELVDDNDRLLAAAPGPVPQGRKRTAVLLLSDVVGADVRVEALPQLVAPGLDVIQMRVARDFLRGLRCLVPPPDRGWLVGGFRPDLHDAVPDLRGQDGRLLSWVCRPSGSARQPPVVQS
jgi:hypothetical protein